MIFTAKGRKYSVSNLGVIEQIDHHPFVYDKNYSAIYDEEKYKQESDKLQALRWGFVLGSHGTPVKSLLDMGYGNGAFLTFIAENAAHVHRMGYDVTGVPLDNSHIMPDLKNADVYTMWDVLEHIPDCSFLRDLRCTTICLSLPFCHFHTEGLDWFENWHHRKPDEHIRHFNVWSLTAFMASFGWKAIAESDHENIVRKAASPLQNILSMAFKR